jgi:biotin carboxylase
MMAGAIGIKKIHSADEFWRAVDSLGDDRSFYLLERFVPGDIFHVDSIVYEREILFAVASGYGVPPLEVSHGGGIFTTRVLERGTAIEQSLLVKNAEVLRALGLVRGVSHTEYIRGHDGEVYFLETSARVGGAHISDLIEAATGLNLWAEWAKVEIAGGKSSYDVRPARAEYAGLIVSLARQEHPDLSGYSDPEVVWRMDKKNHAGVIVRSLNALRIGELLDSYVARFRSDFHAALPPKDRPSH